jgi:hypothetical protein
MASVIKADTLQSTTSNVFVLNSAGTEYARFDADGDLGIGTASPDSKLHILNSAGASLRVGYLGGNTNYYDATTHNFRSANGSPSSFISNQYGIGLASTVPSSGVGIAFPSTQTASSDANTLDDYEEGTWTPSVGGTATYGTRTATYTKIGDTVRAFFDISIGTIGTGSLTTMSGFPFTCTNNDSGCISYFSGLGATVYFIQIQMSGTNCIFVGLTAAGATINNGMNVFTTSARIIGTVVYKTTT